MTNIISVHRFFTLTSLACLAALLALAVVYWPH